MKDFVEEMVELTDKESPGSRSLYDRELSVTRLYAELVASLVAARKEAHLTQSEVARRMGVTQPRIAALEKMRDGFNLRSYIEYADIVGADLALQKKRGRYVANTKNSGEILLATAESRKRLDKRGSALPRLKNKD